MIGEPKEVYFHIWCPTCKDVNSVDENGQPADICQDCLNNPSNIDSHKPVNWKAK